MTKFLLENVYGSSSQDNHSKEGADKNEPVTDYIPGLYMIRRLDQIDDISFGFYRYTKPDKTSNKKIPSTSRGMVEIGLIETSSVQADLTELKLSGEPGQSNSDAVADNRMIDASLSFKKMVIDSKSQPVAELIPGGCLHAEDMGPTTLLSDQVFVDRLASPATFRVALEGELAEKLWALFEEGDVALELSVNWKLRGEEHGKPFQYMITQTIPLLTSMSAQRNYFHKYEVWADVHHDFTQLQVQCFSFMMDNSEGLERVEVVAGIVVEEQKVSHKTVTFDRQDSSSNKIMNFPSLEVDRNTAFCIKSLFYFADSSVKETGWQSHALRYFDATYRATRSNE